MAEFLSGEVAVITGASSGIGKALAIGFADLGANVVVCSRNQEKIDQVAAKINELHPDAALAVAGDVKDYASMESVFAAGKEKFGKINVLIANAGINRLKEITRLRVEKFQDVLNTNIIGVFNCAHIAVPYMLEAGGGSIISTGSMAAVLENSKWALYAMTKSALMGFTANLAPELKRKKIWVTNMMLNIVDTPLLRSGMPDNVIDSLNPTKPEELIPYYA